MSELITNLNAIYNAKLAIKQAIGTNSDNIEDYATYISEMAPSVSGYSYITGNGTYNIASYEYVNVNVPGEIPPGYTYVYGSYNITGNGSYTVSSYESVNVNVPVPSGYIIPSGTYNITTNGTFNISSYENTYVNVPSSPSPSISWDNYNNEFDMDYGQGTQDSVSYSYQLSQTFKTGEGNVGVFINNSSQNPYFATYSLSDISDVFTDLNSLMTTYGNDAKINCNIYDTTTDYITSNIEFNNTSQYTARMEFKNAVWNKEVFDGAYLNMGGQFEISHAQFINQQTSPVNITTLGYGWDGNDYVAISQCDFSNCSEVPINVNINSAQILKLYIFSNNNTFNNNLQYLVTGTNNGTLYIDDMLVESLPYDNPNYSDHDYNGNYDPTMPSGDDDEGW